MGRRWQIVLPTIGILLFGLQTYYAVRQNTEYRKRPDQYFLWSYIRLDTDPLHKPPPAPVDTACKEDLSQDCVGWDPVHTWIDPGPLSKIIVLSGLPAFVIGVLIVRGLSRFGVNELLSFMVSMPVLLFAWYFLLERLFDRRRYKRQMPKSRKS